jgi:hypothetical protein
MSDIKNKITLADRLKAVLLNKVKPVLVGYDTAVLSGGDIPVFMCPVCGREFNTGHQCKCGVKFDWSK